MIRSHPLFVRGYATPKEKLICTNEIIYLTVCSWTSRPEDAIISTL